MAHSRLLVCVVALALSGSLAACGSLAEKAGEGARGTAASDGGELAVGTSGGAGAVSPDGAVAGPGSGTGGLAAGGTSGVPGSEGSTGSVAGTTGGTTGTTGGGAAPSVKPVVLGVTYPDVGPLAAAFGVDASEADPKTWINRIITYINKSSGGISGRPISPIWFKADLGADSSTLGQRACASFTQDNKVDFVVNTGVPGDTLPACLARSGVSMIDQTSIFTTDTTDMRRLRNRFIPNAVRVDRLIPAMVKLSAQAGRLPKGAKLGVLVEDCGWGNRTYDKIVSVTKELGVTPVKGTHRCVQNLVSDLGPVTNDIQREVLRFASEGVTHVAFVSSPEAYVATKFTNNASDQKYYPKYFITSNGYPFNDSRDGQFNYSSDARKNITGYGYNPLMDVGPKSRPATPGQKAVQDRCRTADPKEGIYAKDRGAEGYWFSLNGIRQYCDSFFTLEAVLEANGVRFGLADFTRSYQALLGGKLSSAVNSGGFFRVPPDGLDGAGLLTPFAWQGPYTKAGQFVYTGPAVEIP